MKTSKQVRQAITGYWDGRDEMNIVEFPVALLSERAPKNVHTLKFQDELYDRKTHQMVQRVVTVAGSLEYGLPTAKDEEVLLGMLQLTKITNEFTAPLVHFSRPQLLELLGWKQEGASYKRVTTALNRWIHTGFTYHNSWRDNGQKVWVSRGGFGFLDSYEFRDSRSLNGKANHIASSLEELHSEFRWNYVFFESIQSGYLKKLDYNIVRDLKSALAKRLYRYLDKYFNEPEYVLLKYDLHNLCCEHLGMNRSKDNYHLRKKLQKACKELESIGFLKTYPESKRFIKVGSGVYKVYFEKKSTPPKFIFTSSDYLHVKTNALYQDLLDREVNEEVAASIILSSEYPDDVIREKIEIHDWLVGRKDIRISKNSVGYLVASIYRNYDRPYGFRTKAEIEQARIKAEKQEKMRMMREEEERKKGRDEEEKLVKQIRTYLESLSVEKQQELENKALEATNKFMKSQYRETKPEGGEKYEYWRMEILKDYLRKHPDAFSQ